MGTIKICLSYSLLTDTILIKYVGQSSFVSIVLRKEKNYLTVLRLIFILW